MSAEGQAMVAVALATLAALSDASQASGLPRFDERHVWAWRDNPRGAFVDWTTRVSCEGV